MKQLGHLFLMFTLVATILAANGGIGIAGFAQPLPQSSAVSDDFNHCDACGGKAVAVMTCGTICGSIMAVTAQVALPAPAARSIAWSWADQIATAANIEPEHAPPRS